MQNTTAPQRFLHIGNTTHSEMFGIGMLAPPITPAICSAQHTDQAWGHFCLFVE
jgi:hypothetical protein